MTPKNKIKPSDDAQDGLPDVRRLLLPTSEYPVFKCQLYYIDPLSKNAKEYLKVLSKTNNAAFKKVSATLLKIATEPENVLCNEERYRVLDKDYDIYELKFRFDNIRIFVIRYSPTQLILTHGCSKPQRNALQSHIKKAIKLRKQYIDRKDGESQ